MFCNINVPVLKYRLFLSGFNETGILGTNFQKNTQISNSIKIRPMGAELFIADRRTDTKKINVAFRNFANAAKKCVILCT